jgi:hypothetical protein
MRYSVWLLCLNYAKSLCVCVCVCVCMYVFHVSLIAIKCYILGINDKDNKTLK